jgi:hypothetical protein
MEKYFDKFPKIQYADNIVVDITKRATILDKVYNNPLAYYPYAISSEERADQLSFRYYEDQYQSWLIYFANKIVDPYYEWYLHEREFNEFIIKKYGSYFFPQQKIKHYKNNWLSEDSLTVSGYDALATNQKKYWQPVYGYSNSVVNYKRKEIDWIINTNKIVSYDFVLGQEDINETNDPNKFKKDEICNITFDGSSVPGKGQIVSVRQNPDVPFGFLYLKSYTIFLQHVSGNFDGSDIMIEPFGHINGSESGVISDVSNPVVVVNNIEAEEEVYWRPVSYFEFETDKNDFNKTVQVIDNSLAQIASDNLKELMKE